MPHAKPPKSDPFRQEIHRPGHPTHGSGSGADIFRQDVGTKPTHTGGAQATRPDDRPMGPRSTGVPNKPSRQQTLHGLTTKQVQKLLQARGYHITVDGQMGPETKEAIDAYVKGKSPQQWNRYDTNKFHPNPVAAAAASHAGSGAASVGAAVGKTGKSIKSGKGVSSNFGLDPNTAAFIPESLAAQIASGQFDGQIADVQRALDQLPATKAQNLKSIGDWYGQVLGHEAEAKKNDKAMTDAGTGSVKDAVNSIIASLGGSANQGSGVVGAAGADAVGTLAAEGAAQDQYNNDLVPLLQSEAAGAKVNESNRLAGEQKDLLSKLGDLKGQKGAALAQALLDIKDKNNAYAQQDFQNQFGIAQMNQAGNIAAGKLAVQAGKAATGKGTFMGSSSTQKLGVMQTAVGAIVDPNTGKLRVDIPRAVQLVNSIVAGAGWNRANPAVLQFRNQILQSVGITPQAGWT